MPGKLILTNSASEGTPETGRTELRVDSVTKKLVSIDDSGAETEYAGAGGTIYSNPNPTYPTSEVFGASATATGTDATVFGNNATAVGTGVAIGKGSSTTATLAVAVGVGATAALAGTAIGYNSSAVTSGTALGFAAIATGTNSICIGRGSNANFTNSILIGYEAVGRSNNSFVVGSLTQPANNMFLGRGEHVNSSSTVAATLRPTRPDASITDGTGGALILMGAGSTGNALGSSVKIQTMTATSATGTTQNITWVDQIEANSSSEIILTAKDAATADASLWNNSVSMYLNEASNLLTFKAKYSNGVVKTGTVTLA